MYKALRHFFAWIFENKLPLGVKGTSFLERLNASLYNVCIFSQFLSFLAKKLFGQRFVLQIII